MKNNKIAEILRLEVAPGEAGVRLDQFLAASLEWSRARLQKLLKAGLVKVGGRTRAPSYKVRPGETIAVSVPEPAPSYLVPEPIPLEIIFEDRDLLVVNKPPGLVVHPGAGHPQGTLLNAALYHCPKLKEIGDVSRPGLVHRLDKDTSGVMVLAKTELAHQSLVRQFAARETTKKYQALVWGRMGAETGRISGEIGRHPSDRLKMSIFARWGKVAVTLWRVLEEFPGPVSFLELEPKTGRTHQLRVHLTSLGHPILGDTTYGGGAARLKGAPILSGLRGQILRQLLHAAYLGFTHPRTGVTVGWEAPLAPDFDMVLSYLKKVRNGRL